MESMKYLSGHFRKDILLENMTKQGLQYHMTTAKLKKARERHFPAQSGVTL